jgi:hypothetical protein
MNELRAKQVCTSRHNAVLPGHGFDLTQTGFYRSNKIGELDAVAISV